MCFEGGRYFETFGGQTDRREGAIDTAESGDSAEDTDARGRRHGKGIEDLDHKPVDRTNRA
jgi:hypothetical protein